MDRFKFRAYITVGYEDDDDNEKEVSFYLDNVYIGDEGDVININREFLFDALYNYDDETQDKIEEVLQENSCTGDYESICIERGFYKNPEQCIGIKDKNRKLIYEHDILKDHRGDICIVMWNSELASFMLYKTDMKSIYSPIDTDITNFEVVGNINENKDLLEEI